MDAEQTWAWLYAPILAEQAEQVLIVLEPSQDGEHIVSV